MILELHNAFKNITYIDSNHTYTGSTGQQLTSVTQYIKKLTHPFQLEYMALNTALKESGYKTKIDTSRYKDHYVINGANYSLEEAAALPMKVTAKEVKAKWAKSGMIGTSKGNIIHKYLEDALANKKFQVDYPKAINNLPTEEFVLFHQAVDTCKSHADNFVKDYSHLIPIKSELVVGDEGLGLAGQVDQLFFDTQTQKYHLYDWKTDKEIKKSNYFQQFKAPLAHLDDCNYVKYSLQVNGFYRHLIEKNLNIELGDSFVVWINEANDNYQVLPLLDLKTEIDALLHGSKAFQI